MAARSSSTLAVTAARGIQRAADAIGVGRRRTPATGVVVVFDAIISVQQLRNATRKLFVDGHYAQAVGEGFKLVDNLVQAKSGLAATGFDLMTRSFNQKNPVLRLNPLKTESDLNEQDGYMHIFAGAMRAVRNPRAHRAALRDEPEVALELLVFANHLIGVLGRATRARRHKR